MFAERKIVYCVLPAAAAFFLILFRCCTYCAYGVFNRIMCVCEITKKKKINETKKAPVGGGDTTKTLFIDCICFYSTCNSVLNYLESLS